MPDNTNQPTVQTAKSGPPTKQTIEYLGFFALAMPAFGALLCLGYLLLFLLSSWGNLHPSYSLLITGLGTLAAVLLALPTRKMLRKGQTSRAAMLYALGFGIFFLLLHIAWQGFVIMSIVGVWLPPILLYSFMDTRKEVLILAGISGVFTGLILLTGQFRILQPAVLTDPTSLPAMVLTVFVVLAFVSIAVITYLLRFRTVRNRLTATFIVVTLLPAAATVLVLSFQSIQHDRQLAFAGMDAAAAQKLSRIDQIVSRMERDRDTAVVDPRVAVSIVGLLTASPDALYYNNSLATVREYFPARIRDSGLYQNVMLLNARGGVAYATDYKLNWYSFADSPFFQQALSAPYSTTVTNSEAFGPEAFLTARPVRSAGKTVGELVYISDYAQFADAVLTAAGANDLGETYLVSEDFRPLTNIDSTASSIQTVGAVRAVKDHASGNTVYQNYSGTDVLGAYHWIPELRAALITERSQVEVLAGTLLLIGNMLIIGIFAIGLSVMAVIFTSRTLTEPIRDLASAAESASHGDLSARADAARPDELGSLAASFNFMAASLQETIGSLETRIDERTKDLQRQAQRLRAAAEISRDSAAVLHVDDMLTRSVELIAERFGFYHVGIYLLDANRENLILKAATGEAGRLLLETGHHVKGGAGLVARVAQTGENQLTGDANRESAGGGNTLFPGTRSELALPLKIHNVLVGVLDTHSDQANAFSEQDVEALRLMSDQLAAAIERARVLQESENNLRELERSYSKFTRESWQALVRARGGSLLGYRYEGVDVYPLAGVPAAARQALLRGEQVILGAEGEPAASTVLAVPLRLRGTTVGAINLKIRGTEVPTETTRLAQELSERLTQSLEVSMLVSESRARAERERFISGLSSRLGAAPDVENILRATIDELGNLVGEERVTIRLRSANGLPSGEKG